LSLSVRPRLSPRSWLLILAAFILPRLALLCLSLAGHFDLQSYVMVQRAMHAGQPLYANPALEGRYPYLPPWAWVLQGLGWLGLQTGWPAWVVVKLPALAAEAGIVWLLAGAGGLPAALAYALSPLSWVVTAGHGQFDAVVLLLLLAPALSWGRPGWRAGLGAGLWLGAAIAFKSWPVFVVPVFFASAGDRRAAWGLLLIALALPLLCLLPYVAAEGLGPVAARLAYGGQPDVFLTEALVQGSYVWAPAAWLLRWWQPAAFGLLGLAWLGAWTRGRGVVRGLALQLLLFLILAPAVGVQYLIWPLPFLALQRPALAWRYSLAAALPMLGYYLLWSPEALYAGWPLGLVQRTVALQGVWIALNVLGWIALIFIGLASRAADTER
jgi:hypothetical protein